jgi:hypothetical protein
MCTQVHFANKQRGAIASLGGTDSFLGAGQRWGLKEDKIIEMIEGGKWSFFVDAPTETPPNRVKIVVAMKAADGRKFLKTEPDGDEPNNLLALPEQNPPLTDVDPPGLGAGLPPARKPELKGVFSAAQPAPLPQPDANGLLPVLPSTHIFIRFSAPFSNRYEVRVNGEFPLYEAPSETFRLPEPLEKQGWFALSHIGYFGPFDPQTPLQIARDMTIYQLRVRLPETVIQAPLVSILLAQLSANPNCQKPYDKSAYLLLTLSRPPPAPPPTDTRDPSGVETIGLVQKTEGDKFDFTALVGGARLKDARITTVGNVSRDKDGQPTPHFFKVDHTDDDGATVSHVGTVVQPYMLAGESNTDFAGLLVNGTWSVRVTGPNLISLDPRRIALEVAWRRN